MTLIPGNSGTTARIEIGTTVYGERETSTDHDWYRVDLVAGVQYEFRMHGIGTGELSDTFLTLYNPNGSTVEIFNDDIGVGSMVYGGSNRTDSRIIYTATETGTFFLDASGFSTNTGDYIVTAVEADPAGMVFTVDEIAWQLSNNFSEFNGWNAAAFNVGGDGSISVNITGLTADGQTLALAALEAWTNVTGINFVTTAGAAEITFDDSDAGVNAYAGTSGVGSQITSATVMITTGWLDQFGTGINSYSFETYMHEIGHALGLGHGGNYNGSATYGVDNFYVNDSLAYSLMSYMQANDDEFSGPNTNIDASFRYMLTPQIADIIAIQLAYGDTGNHFTGDTVYGNGANTGSTAIDNAAIYGASAAFTVYDNGGTDTLNFTGGTVDQVIDLRAEHFSNVWGGRMNVAIARGVTIENAYGGSAADTIYGNEVGNVITGEAGSDTLLGNEGDDIIFGTNFALVGDTGVTNFLWGGAGNDTLYGAEGDDLLVGGTGADTFVSGDGDDWIYVDGEDITTNIHGGNGLDRVFVNTPNATFVFDVTAAQVEVVFGGNEQDTLDASGSNSTVYLIGAAGNDTVIGGNAVDVLWGYGDNDTLYGNGSTDWLYAGTGADQIYGGEGDDFLIGGAGLGSGDGNADVFHFGDNSGTDRVYEFDDGIDLIDLSSKSGLASFSQLAISSIDGGINSAVTFGADTIYLIGIDASQLTEADFIV